jgi:hypothetical protein
LVQFTLSSDSSNAAGGFASRLRVAQTGRRSTAAGISRFFHCG